MDFELTEEQRMFQLAIRDFAQKRIAPLVKEAEEKEEMPVHLFRELGELGYLCPRYPVELGGGGLGKIGDCIGILEIAKVCAGIAAGLMVQAGIATSAIYDHGSEELKEKYLKPAIRGEKIAAFGLTEPNAGSDASAIETTAQRQGDKYIVNGSKIFITNGPIADFITLAAYTDKSKGPREGISLFVFDTKTPGFSARKLKKVGMWSAATGELYFDNCEVPSKNLIGEEGKGLRYLLEALAGGRISHSARSIGVAESALELALNYAKERKQFGQPIGKFQAVAFKLANMATQLEAAKHLMFYAAWLYDKGVDCRKEACMAKLFASEVACKITEDAMQIHAGYGYMMDSAIQRLWRDARIFTVTEGTSEVQLLVISRGLGL